MTKVFTHNFPFVRALLETRRSISHRLTFIVYLETIHDFCILAEHLGHKGSSKNYEKHLDTHFSDAPNAIPYPHIRQNPA